MQTTISNESITFIMTDASLQEKILEGLNEYQQANLTFHVVHTHEEIRSCLELQQKEAKKYSSQQSKYIWVIDERDQKLAKDILSFGQASIIAKESSCLIKSMDQAIKHYPCLDLPFQQDILMTVYRNNKPKQKEDLTICLDSYKEFNRTEKDIIYYLLQGKTAEQIAEQTYNSVHTINNNIVKIKRKLNVKSKVEIITHFVKKNRS
ncbi:LuxR C-terminal-related transcriptional regulator [Alkalihalophilus marmarensis]|uniref:LuxR C-terminal-related transcriptional regulator n=1 Tax=Alkalihalophilus marmarensis TaxID=521377 RepID=UPI002E207EE1|nr:LuxR C-terminal-related transcriptional regulator [Alkalihalophilus marmarensis]MED1603081.1 LuxR C-terminal-related transcriptional regulator [Alkalihalophilus marmarensis]